MYKSTIKIKKTGDISETREKYLYLCDEGQLLYIIEFIIQRLGNRSIILDTTLPVVLCRIYAKRRRYLNPVYYTVKRYAVTGQDL